MIATHSSYSIPHTLPCTLRKLCKIGHHLVSGRKSVVLRVPVIQRFQKGVGARVPKGGEGKTNITECRGKTEPVAGKDGICLD